jgi:hypothetical protein
MRTDEELIKQVYETYHLSHIFKWELFKKDFTVLEALFLSMNCRHTHYYILKTGQDGLDRIRTNKEVAEVAGVDYSTIQTHYQKVWRDFMQLAGDRKKMLGRCIRVGVPTKSSYDRRLIGKTLIGLHEVLSLPVKKKALKPDREFELELEIKYLREVIKMQEVENSKVQSRAVDFIRSLQVSTLIKDPWKDEIGFRD